MDERNTYIHDAYISMAERTIKRQWVTIILLVLMLFGTNIAWLWYESQFETVTTTTVTQDLKSDSGNAIINDGVHLYGESNTDSYNN